MTLTDNGRIFIAENFGVGNCFVSTGLTWTAVDVNNATANESGGTAQIVARLLTPSVYKVIIIVTPTPQAGAYTPTQLIAANDNQGITVTEVSTEIAGKDGNPAGEEQYCTTPCVPDWQCETPPNGYEFDGCGNRRLNTNCNPENGDTDFAGIYEFIGPPEGDPTVILDLSALEMRQDLTDYHFEMNNIVITSTSPQVIYIALEVRLFTGALDHCPTSGEVFAGMDRVSTTKIVRIKVLDPGEVNNINADFYQPEAMRGVHTVCLLVHGAWTRDELESEVALISG